MIERERGRGEFNIDNETRVSFIIFGRNIIILMISMLVLITDFLIDEK